MFERAIQGFAHMPTGAKLVLVAAVLSAAIIGYVVFKKNSSSASSTPSTTPSPDVTQSMQDQSGGQPFSTLGPPIAASTGTTSGTSSGAGSAPDSSGNAPGGAPPGTPNGIFYTYAHYHPNNYPGSVQPDQPVPVPRPPAHTPIIAASSGLAGARPVALTPIAALGAAPRSAAVAVPVRPGTGHGAVKGGAHFERIQHPLQSASEALHRR